MKWDKKDGCNTVEEVIKRNVKTSISDFVNLKQSYYLYGIESTASAVKNTISKNEKITIVGDYDCDGITASAILYLTLKELGVDATVRLPKRFSEGYGLSEKIIDEIDSGLVLTVDNGISAYNAIKKAKNKGLTVIIIDHHQLTGELPPADIIVNPHCVGNSDFCDYCGAGLAFRLAKELVSNERFIEKMSGLAAIGTIADIVPLVKDNRSITINGLKALNNGIMTKGMSVLLNELKVNSVDETSVGYTLAPTLNASGRLIDDGAMLSFEMLVSEDENQDILKDKAENLVKLNNDRKDMVREGLAQCENQVNEIMKTEKSAAIVYIPNVNEGIIGILAGQIAENLHRPCIVFTDSKAPEEIKGSGRSYGNINLKDLLDQTNCSSSSIIKYGGHPGAAGLTIKKSSYQEFKDIFTAKTDSVSQKDFDTEYYDLEIKQSEIDNYYNKLQKYRPFGEGNNPIVFVVKGFKPCLKYGEKYRNIGKTGVKIFGKNNDAISFDVSEKFKALSSNRTWNLLGEISSSTFNGKTTVQFLFRDIK